MILDKKNIDIFVYYIFIYFISLQSFYKWSVYYYYGFLKKLFALLFILIKITFWQIVITKNK